MSLNNPDSRRALRSVIHSISALVLTGLLFWLTGLLKHSNEGLITIARGALTILGVGEFMYGAENVSRAVKISTPLGSAEVGDDESKPAGS
jgi:hypothetical protein